MVRKSFNLLKGAMLVMVLAFVFIFSGCASNRNQPQQTTAVAVQDPLSGTWVTSGMGEAQEQVRFSNGMYEASQGGSLTHRGRYTTESGRITLSITHIYGEILGLEARWYSEDDLRDIFKQILLEHGIAEEYLNEFFEAEFGGLFAGMTLNYTLEDSTLTLTNEFGEEIVFTRRGSIRS